MARYRPSWLPPRINYPREASEAAIIGPLMLSRRTWLCDFSPGSGRRQCHSVTKATGKRCRNDCVQGFDRCRFHGAKRRTPERALANAVYRARPEYSSNVEG